NTEKLCFSSEFNEVYFQASSFLVGNPLSSKIFMAEVRISCNSSSALTRSSNAMNDDINFSFNAIFICFRFQVILVSVVCNSKLYYMKQFYTNSSLIQSYPFSSSSNANSL